MKKLVPQTGGHPFRLNDLILVQNALTDIATAVSGMANAGNNCVLQGCAVSGNNIAGGWIYFNGEVYQAIATVLPSPGLGQTLYWNVVEVTEDPVTLASPYTVKYQDTVFKGVHKKRTMVPVWATSGDVSDSALPRIANTLVNGGTNPIGSIMMWNGNIANFFTGTGLGISNLTGWALCNGQNGTTDLRSRFIVGYDPAVTDYNTLGKIGGSSSSALGIANLPAHNHAITVSGSPIITTSVAGNHNHNVTVGNQGSGQRAQGQTSTPQSGSAAYGTDTQGAHTHTVDLSGLSYSTSSVGSGTAFENRPPYYTLAYIQRIS